MKNSVFLLAFLLTVLSCNDTVKTRLANPISEEKDSFFLNYKKGDIRPDTLYLEVQLDDCGEWGGPPEKFVLYVDSLQHYKLDYKLYRFNCDSVDKYYSLKNKPLDYKASIVLNKKTKKIVSDFFTHILQAKISEQVYSNAGSTYWLYNNDSTLNINVYSEQKEIMEKFRLFKVKLGLPDRGFSREKGIIIETIEN